jgi:hypothetical protein
MFPLENTADFLFFRVILAQKKPDMTNPGRICPAAGFSRLAGPGENSINTLKTSAHSRL